MSMFQKLLRAGEGKKVKLLESIVPEVAKWEPEVSRLTDDQLAAKTVEFRGRVDKGEDLDELLPEAFAVVREAGTRRLGQRHYDVQVMGGAALHFGWVAEMKTGEGKTLVATLPAYLNALTGRSVHLVTVNDYLAKRDAEWMGQVYGLLGLSVGVVIPRLPGLACREAGGVRLRHHPRHQQRVRLRLPARQHVREHRGADAVGQSRA